MSKICHAFQLLAVLTITAKAAAKGEDNRTLDDEQSTTPTSVSDATAWKRHGSFDFKIEDNAVFRKKLGPESEWQKLYQGNYLGGPAAIVPQNESEIYLFSWGHLSFFSSGSHYPTISKISVVEDTESYERFYDLLGNGISARPVQYFMDSNFFTTDSNTTLADYRIDMMIEDEVLYILLTKDNRGAISGFDHPMDRY